MRPTTPAEDPGLLERARHAIARRGLDMSPQDYLTLWDAVYGDAPEQGGSPARASSSDSWSLQLEAALQGTLSPQMVRSIAATERLWIRIGAEFGLPSGEEVAQWLDLPSHKWRPNKLEPSLAIGVFRKGKLRYPGFQFDRDAKRVRPVIKTLISIAADHRLDMEDLTLKMVGPSTYFEGGSRPVDHLDAPDLADKMRQKLSVEW